MEEATGLNKILQEAHMLRALIHPRITKLEDIFSDGHNLYIVMELLSGKSSSFCSFL
jgi:serine/threonine protein kinase